MTNPCTTFHASSSRGSLVTAIKPAARENFRTAVLFVVLHSGGWGGLIKVSYFFRQSSRPMTQSLMAVHKVGHASLSPHNFGHLPYCYADCATLRPGKYHAEVGSNAVTITITFAKTG
jgi:hypothetical protein